MIDLIESYMIVCESWNIWPLQSNFTSPWLCTCASLRTSFLLKASCPTYRHGNFYNAMLRVSWQVPPIAEPWNWRGESGESGKLRCKVMFAKWPKWTGWWWKFLGLIKWHLHFFCYRVLSYCHTWSPTPSHFCIQNATLSSKSSNQSFYANLLVVYSISVGQSAGPYSYTCHGRHRRSWWPLHASFVSSYVGVPSIDPWRGCHP